MKLTAWLLIALAPLTVVSGMAQPTNTAPPPTPPPPIVTAVPETTAAAPAAPEKTEKAEKTAKKTKHKKSTKAIKKTKTEKTARTEKEAPAKSSAKTNEVMALNPPVTASVKCNVLDVRGQPGFIGEIITYLKKGENAVVLEEIKLAHVHPGEPEHWSKIVMPGNTAVWVSGEYIDKENHEVRAKKVNVRGGPGENYSVVARLDKGTVVTEIGRKAGWLEIAAPTNAFAYIASEFLEVQPQNDTIAATTPAAPTPTPAPAPAPPAPVVVNVPPADTAPVAGKTPETAHGITAPAPSAQPPTEAPAPPPTPAPVVTAPPPAVTQPEPGKMEVPRIVTRDGYLHRSYNIQSPTGYELRDIKTGVLTEYVQPEPKDKLKKFIGTRVRITGSESLDDRWQRTPVLHVQSVDLIP